MSLTNVDPSSKVLKTDFSNFITFLQKKWKFFFSDFTPWSSR